MTATAKFNELLMVANGGHESAADRVFTDTLAQFSRGFSNDEKALMGGYVKDRTFLRFYDFGIMSDGADLRLVAVGIGGGWYLLPDRPAIYMYVDLDPINQDMMHLGRTSDGDIYEIINGWSA